MVSEARQRRVREEWAEIKATAAAKKSAGLQFCVGQKRGKESWLRQAALIPEDTRDLTARLMGDPIPSDPRRARR